MESITTAQEVIQFAKQNKALGYLLKLDFEKAYDVEWDCILEALQSEGSLCSWITWITLWLSSAKMAIMVNGIRGKENVCKKGLRQGDPLSP